ncbi:TRAP transporter small permease [Anaerotruncus sp. AF02-27]|jgi:TRAP-type C4-dicarboxylate transport system permease small subunit|nr:TRAP transporter small permease [Anaerotruncus sp. AF02-27]
MCEMKTLKKINDMFIRVSEYIAFILSAVICALIIWWAAKRYLFNGDFRGAEELILAIAFWMYFIGAYIATHEDSHISADLFTSMLKTQKAKNIAKLVRLVISLFAFVLLTWLAYDFVTFDIVRHKISVIFRFPVVYIHIVLLISFGMSCLYTVAHIVKTVIALREGSPAPEDNRAEPGQIAEENE